MMLGKLGLVIMGIGAGTTVAAGIFALISALGIVPRLMQRTKTQKYTLFYENCIIVGGILGTILSFWDIVIPIGEVGLGVLSLGVGLFIGSLAIALAEFINVVPIMNRRFKMTGGIAFLLLTLALGKTTGSLFYWLVPGLRNVK